ERTVADYERRLVAERRAPFANETPLFAEQLRWLDALCAQRERSAALHAAAVANVLVKRGNFENRRRIEHSASADRKSLSSGIRPSVPARSYTTLRIRCSGSAAIRFARGDSR